MKKKITYNVNEKVVEREINYIPVRYIIAITITVLEIAAVIGTVVLCCAYIPYFYIAALLTEIGCIIKIIATDDNPDYKVPWIIIILVLPIAGFMLYFLFYSRTLNKKFTKRMKFTHQNLYRNDDPEIFTSLEREDKLAARGVNMLTDISGVSLYRAEHTSYYPLGEDMHSAMLEDLRSAEKFIFMEYFIIEEGEFWGSILEILKEKASHGVEVRVVYDDIGCMSTLPGNYYKILAQYGIKTVTFSRLRGNADSEFNNRSHRKICVVDGRVGYTGGVNIADEYINKVVRFGHWKDVGVRITGTAVNELTNLFLLDYNMNSRVADTDLDCFYNRTKFHTGRGYIVPFGDGPRPMYTRNVSKCAIQNMLATARDYVYITTPYLIIDNELCASLESAALRGIDVRIVLPHIPDKKLVFMMSRSFYSRLMRAGVRIYEYVPGFIHAKTYLCDDVSAIVGTVNLDYRSLVHHFENGVWMYGTECIGDIRRDLNAVIEKSIEIHEQDIKAGIFTRFARSVIRLFAPML